MSNFKVALFERHSKVQLYTKTSSETLATQRDESKGRNECLSRVHLCGTEGHPLDSQETFLHLPESHIYGRQVSRLLILEGTTDGLRKNRDETGPTRHLCLYGRRLLTLSSERKGSVTGDIVNNFELDLPRAVLLPTPSGNSPDRVTGHRRVEDMEILFGLRQSNVHLHGTRVLPPGRTSESPT